MSKTYKVWINEDEWSLHLKEEELQGFLDVFRGALDVEEEGSDNLYGTIKDEGEESPYDPPEVLVEWEVAEFSSVKQAAEILDHIKADVGYIS